MVYISIYCRVGSIANIFIFHGSQSKTLQNSAETQFQLFIEHRARDGNVCRIAKDSEEAGYIETTVMSNNVKKRLLVDSQLFQLSPCDGSALVLKRDISE